VISPLASVHPDAKIAGNVRIDAFAVVEHDTVLGEGSWIMSGAHVLAGSRLGKNCRIHQGAVVGGMPQDLKFSGEYSEVFLGDGCIVRECATINRGTKAYGKTTLGKECLVMAYAHVAHDCIIGDHVILVNNVALAGHVEIGDWTILGGLSAVHQFVKVGSHVMVGGGSLVRKDIPPFITVAREPLTFEGVNAVGLRRRGFTNARIEEIHHAYRLLYQSGFNTTQAVSEIEREVTASPERTELIKFVLASDRGIVRKQ
jgi:UDP-N-acetylglucosamine acyltransferase